MWVHSTLIRGQRVGACFAFSKLLTTSDYKTRGPDLEWLIGILSTEVYQLHLDQRSEVLCLFILSCWWSLLPPPLSLWSGVWKDMENKGVTPYSLNFPSDAVLCFIFYFSLISVSLCLIILIITLLPSNVWIQSRLVLSSCVSSISSLEDSFLLQDRDRNLNTHHWQSWGTDTLGLLLK